MSFMRSLRQLQADGLGRRAAGVAVAAAVLAAWLTWFVAASVRIYQLCPRARIEVQEAAFAVQAEVGGRVSAVRAILGQSVQPGEVLFELDASRLLLALSEERTRGESARSQLLTVQAQMATKGKALAELHQAFGVTLDEARAEQREAEAGVQIADEELRRAKTLFASRHVSEAEVQRLEAEGRKRRAVADQKRLAVDRKERDLRAKEREAEGELDRLRRDAVELTGTAEASAAAVQRIAHDIDLNKVRSPVGGQVGEIAQVHAGTVVAEREKLATVVPKGEFKIVADFDPWAAVGQIRAGQPARLRLDAFPWAEFGTLDARVERVASELRDRTIRVEFGLSSAPPPAISLQHGMSGTVEVEVDRLSPAALMLRTAGKMLRVPESSAAGRGAEGG